jgi:FlaA1/EpsC-like NDP-sugar epimerase
VSFSQLKFDHLWAAAKSSIPHYRRCLIRIFHVIIIAVSLGAAFLLRFDFWLPRGESSLLYRGLWIALLVKSLVFHFGGVDQGWWRFAGMADLYRLLLANVSGSLLLALAARLMLGPQFPRSIYFIDFLLCFLGTAGARFAVRVYYESIAGEFLNKGRKGLLIYGAGAAGMTLLREIRANPGLGYDVIGFLDDDRNKQNATLMGVRVLGSGRSAPYIVDRRKMTGRRVEEIIIAMPSATGRQMQEALANCRAAGVACKTVPGIGELLAGKVLAGQIRSVAIGDLLGREPVRLEESRIRSAIAAHSILITGAGGSIGSELCRQVARFEPLTLVAFDQAESELFKIDLELRRAFPSVPVVAQLGDIRDYHAVEEVVRRHSITSIFHAAAYKHVPMLESHVLEAVKNNILGTHNLAKAALENEVSDFLLISSDKAVNPSNIMGVTKRVAELIVSSMPAGTSRNGTKFVSVRFGNVLGSNGSVVPIFQDQIAAGGPVTVTHPEVRRYFMTTREAVQLVLQASTMGRGSETFVLDMGEPVRVVDLARNMIRLSGKIPDEEIEIRFTGLRPGEKLYEELITETEGIQPTYHEKIKIFSGPRPDPAYMEDWLIELEALVAQRDEQAVIAHLTKMVPEYQGAKYAGPRRQFAAAASQ